MTLIDGIRGCPESFGQGGIMSDFRELTGEKLRTEEVSSLFERDWHRESDPTEAMAPPSQARFFEGASSMTKFSDQLTADSDVTQASGQDSRRLLKDAETTRNAGRRSPVRELEPDPTYLSRFLDRAQALYAGRDFKACLEILHDGLKLAPGNPEILSLMEKARQASQLGCAEQDLTDRFAQDKVEAIRLFEQGQNSDCVERFKLLSEHEPGNPDLRHYLEVSREQAQAQQPSQLHLPLIVPPDNQNVAVRETPSPDVPAPALISHAEPPPPAVGGEPQRSDRLEVPTVEPVPRFAPTQGDVVAEAIPERVPQAAQQATDPTTTQANQTEQGNPRTDQKETKPEVTVGKMADSPKGPIGPKGKNLKIAALAGVGLAAGALIGLWLALGPARQPDTPEVPLRPESRQVAIEPPQPRPDLNSPAEDDLGTQAQRAFQEGRLPEAIRFCETILETDPDNTSALNMKQAIRDRFSKVGSRAMANQRWEEASVAWNNLLKVMPNDPEASRQLKAAKANLKKQEQIGHARKLESEKRIKELHEQIVQAISSGRYLPPNSQNALELIRELERVSPDDAFVRENLDRIFRDLMASANRTLQAKDFGRASTLVKQMQMYFPETPELKALRDSIQTGETRLAEARNSWMQRAQTAMTAGHYVTPANDNVAAYCSQVLALDPRNLKAIELRKDGFAKAGAQAKAYAREGKYDDARVIYSSLLYLSQNESQFPFSSQDLKAEVDRLTFSAYPVVHDHAIGSCTGRLRINGYQIAYVPTTDSKDGFAAKISEIVQVDQGDKLKILFKGKTYRFQTNATKGSQEGRATISDIQQQLNAVIASGK
jgi:tetratricopeptide (TPR) repeat protein